MSEIALFLFIAIAVMLWFDGRRVQEIAVVWCRQACQRAGLQFLDDVAPLWRMGLSRDTRGVLRLRRTYTFDYTTSLGERRSGSIVMLGRTPVALRIENGNIFDVPPEEQGPERLP